MILIVKSILSVVIILSALSSVALPQVGDRAFISKLQSRGGGLTSKVTFKKLQRAYNFSGKELYDKSLSILTKLEKATKNRKFEYAQVLQAKAMIYAQKGEYGKGLKTIERALKTEGLSYALTVTTLYTGAQLSLGAGKAKTARKYLNDWFRAVEKGSASGYVLNAYIEMELGSKKEALESIEKAMALTTSPRASWLQLAAMLQIEFKNYKKASGYLVKLITMEPKKKNHWKTLVGVYLNLDQYKKALSTMELAHKSGLLSTEAEITNLVSLQIQNGIPYWGAQLLEDAVKKGLVKKSVRILHLLAQGWVMAEETDRALSPLIEAEKIDPKGKSAIKLGQLYIEKEQWPKAQRYLATGIRKGGIRYPERAHLALGIVYFSQDKFNKARGEFSKSLESKLTKSSSEQWLNHLSEKI